MDKNNEFLVKRSKDDDDEMRTIVADIRKNDQRRLEALKSQESSPPPQYETLFPERTPCHQLPLPVPKPESVAGNASQTSDASLSGQVAAKMELGTDYDPSLWYYEPGPNPIPYDMGKKVINPFTDNLRTLQNKGDKAKLKDLSVRKVYGLILLVYLRLDSLFWCPQNEFLTLSFGWFQTLFLKMFL